MVTETHAGHLTVASTDPLPPEPLISPELLDRLVSGSGDVVEEAREALCGLDSAGPEDLRRQSTVSFLEHRLAETTPGWGELVGQYKEQIRPGLDAAAAGRELEAALIVASRTEIGADGQLTPLLIPKAHGFVSQGRTVSGCLREGHLNDKGETSCPECEAAAYPLAFCASCGHEFYVASLVTGDMMERLLPREFEALEHGGVPVYISPEPWDS